MTIFLSSNPDKQHLVDHLRSALTLCQLGGMSIHFATLYNNGTKKPILIFDGIEIKEEDKHEEKIN